ncbi:hypothetical protein Vadar_016482 [Vaccinium darrowii]|uniref:Uncharacterized protein n=1 Tax=Vaccinium darrowii TaxID=229202 RepID=A0ACB7YF54_9ERIC|nr:hypothetical protein Vadar_016482 [Vaccinium darrowii]
MVEVLVFSYTAIRDWVLNLLIALWAGVVLGGALQYLVFRQPINLNFGFDRKPDLVLGPCHGLFCLYWMPPTFCRRVGRRWLPSIALWNHATRAFSILPMSKLGLPPYNTVHCRLVGFGFDLVTKCIKVVKVVKFDEATDYEFKNCAEVYDLGSGSWRVLDVDDTLQEVCLSDQPINDMCMYNNNDGVFHWDSYGNFCGDIKRHISLVLSFDMSQELFHVTLMPKKYDKWGTVYYFSLLRDSLAVNFSFLKAGHNTTEIWVMKKDLFHGIGVGESFSSYSWSHELTVELPEYVGPCFAMGFLNKNELLLWKFEWGLTPFLYDIVTKQARYLGEVKFIYKESIVPV